MKSMIKYCLIFIFSFFLPYQVYAWNAEGHMLVATIAYEHLNPAVKSKVDNLIATFNKEYPAVTTLPQMALWPDELRSQKIDTFTHWHYINLTYSPDGTLASKNLIDSDNAVWALKQIMPIVAYDKANVFERARFLAFLVHIVGDLHQPLHAVARVTASLPAGDEGGNLFKIKHSASNLHSLWDSGLGVFSGGTSPANITALAHTVTTLYPQEYFGARVNDLRPDHWADDDLELAKSTVYNLSENQAPSTGYIGVGKTTAEQQAALAGYRLAALLNQLLG